MRLVIYGPFVDHQVHLANALPDDSHVLMALPLPEVPERVRRIAKQGIDIHTVRIGGHRRYVESLLGLMEFWKRVKEFKPDVVHVQLGGGWTELAILPFLLKYLIVVTFHDVELHPGDVSLKASLVRDLYRKRADKIIVHGDILKEMMTKRFRISPQKVHSIPLGAPDLDAFREFERRGAHEEGRLVLFFGRILEYKGLEYLVKAEPFITRQVPDARIVIAGYAEEFGNYSQMMAGREDSFIVLNRRISFQEGADLFQKCSVVVLPYIEGSQSGVVPIAYGFRKPVVVTKVGSIPEVVIDGKTGLVVPPRDSKSLAAAIVKLLKDDRLRGVMGENGYELLASTLSWDVIASRTFKVYKSAIAHKKN